jgi:DNA-binding response OmpR family regulator
MHDRTGDTGMEEPKTVLIVEDSRVQAEALKHLLIDQDFEVLWAQNGKDGVLLARIHLPDLIVLDIEMPEMDGLEACQQLKDNIVTRDIPIIMLTSHTDLDTLNRGLNLGAIDFIPKDTLSGPVLLETLMHLETVREF